MPVSCVVIVSWWWGYTDYNEILSLLVLLYKDRFWSLGTWPLGGHASYLFLCTTVWSLIYHLMFQSLIQDFRLKFSSVQLIANGYPDHFVQNIFVSEFLFFVLSSDNLNIVFHSETRRHGICMFGSFIVHFSTFYHNLTFLIFISCRT
jgi:hypothetical protein